MLNYEFPPLGGGASPVCYGLSKELVRLGHEVDVITMGFRGLKKYEIIDGINVYRVSCLRRKKEMCYTEEMLTYVMSAIPKALQLIRWKKYDVNHTHFIIPTGAVSYILKRLTGLRYVITSHGSDVQGYNPDRFKLQHRLIKPFWTRIAANADAIVSPSISHKALIEKNIATDKVRVIPYGFDSDSFAPKEKQKRILLVSRLLKRKGFQYFLDAIRSLDIDYEVNIVGNGPYKETLMQKAKGINARINFRGWLEKYSPEFKELYETSSIFVLPSEKESFGVVLMEAMAAGMAIITTNISGCPEVVGDCALFVKPRNSKDIRNALLKLIQNDDLRRSLGEKAAQRVKSKLSWGRTIPHYVMLYKKISVENLLCHGEKSRR